MGAPLRCPLQVALWHLLCQGGEAAASSLDDFAGFPNRDYLVGISVAGKDRFAWVEKQRGVVNLWAADEADGWAPRRLTNNTEDDGHDSFDLLQPTPDGLTLVFVSGVTADVNPNHLATPPVKATYSVPFTGGTVIKLANTSGCALSVDGKSFHFTSRGGSPGASASLWQQPLGPGQAPQRAFSVKQGGIASLAWRPGGGLLAFANDRGDHGFVGLYSPASPALVWAAASVDTDMQPVWSPSGHALAWVRATLPDGNVGFGPLDGNMGNRGPNFGIMVAEVTLDIVGRPVVGEVHEIFRDEKFGMLSFGYGQRPLLWANDSAVVFGTEALSSWAHAVLLEAWGSGRSAAPQELRPGECEDISWLLGGGGGGWVYLVNNCLQLDGVGVERVRLSDLSRETITEQGGAPSVAGMSSNGYGLAVLSRHVAMLGASYNSPTAVYVAALGGADLRCITRDPTFARHNFVQPKSIQFKSQDGLFTLHAQLFVSNASATEAAWAKAPGIVYSHGGSERQMYPAFHYASCYAQQYAANQWLASQGAAVLSVNYRSGTGYGHRFRVCASCMSHGAAEYMDIREAALQLASLPGVDGERIGIWGISYGGLNAEQACARDSGLFKACVAIAGIFNWVSASRYFTDTGFSVYDADDQPSFPSSFHSLHLGPEPAWAGPTWPEKVKLLQALMLESSPAGHVENLTSPMLLIHGDADEEVDFQESLGAVRAVRALGRSNIRALVYPDEAHGLATYTHQLQALQATADFLWEHLAAGARAVWT